jgi:2-C-methyl-D-erythritol 4-phosphate cytidylyltransferase
MTMRSHVTAVVLAGGIGNRAGSEGLPKQFRRVAGKPILQHTLEAFELASCVDDIVVVVDARYAGLVDRIQLDGGLTKLVATVTPGETRNDSTRNALVALPEDDRKLLIHDGVRPLLDQRIITDCVLALDTADAADVVVPSADTLVRVDEAGTVVDVPDRSRLRRGQTPQAFRSDVLREAYRLAGVDATIGATDDCGVLRRTMPHVPIATVAGSEDNIKVTYPQDFLLADQLFRLRASVWSSAEANRATTVCGRNYVVFGGTRGIGAAIVAELRNAGARAIAFSRTTAHDVRRPDDVASAFETASAELGRIDGVIVTAGVLRTGELVEADHGDVVEMIDANLTGAAVVAQAAFPYLRETRGALVLFGSSSYTRGRPGYAVYSATKAAIVNLVQGLADEWVADGVRVNCLSPGRTATELRKDAFGTEDGELLGCDEVAQATLDLIASTTTGTVLDVRPAMRALALTP